MPQPEPLPALPSKAPLPPVREVGRRPASATSKLPWHTKQQVLELLDSFVRQQRNRPVSSWKPLRQADCGGGGGAGSASGEGGLVRNADVPLNGGATLPPIQPAGMYGEG